MSVTALETAGESIFNDVRLAWTRSVVVKLPAKRTSVVRSTPCEPPGCKVNCAVRPRTSALSLRDDISRLSVPCNATAGAGLGSLEPTRSRMPDPQGTMGSSPVNRCE